MRIIKKIKGFTLVESLVAITILVIGVLGPMTAATRGISDGLYAQNRLMATYLAQEGLEALSNHLDNNIAAGDANGDSSTNAADFLSGLADCVASCGLSVASNATFTFSSCGTSPDNCDMAFQTTDKMYRSYISGSADFSGPVFRRTLTIEYTVPAAGTSDIAEASLISKVEWRNRAADILSQEITLTRYVNHNVSYTTTNP